MEMATIYLSLYLNLTPCSIWVYYQELSNSSCSAIVTFNFKRIGFHWHTSWEGGRRCNNRYWETQKKNINKWK